MDRKKIGEKLEQIDQATSDSAFNEYPNEPNDWKESTPMHKIKSEDEIYTPFLIPSTKTKFRIMKGFDETTKEIKTGIGFSGFSETNTSELTTGAYKDDINVGARYINYTNILLSDLEAFQTLYNIDVSPVHRSILNQREMFGSLTKGINFLLGKALTTSKAEMIRTDSSTQQINNSAPTKKSWFSGIKLGGKPKNTITM